MCDILWSMVQARIVRWHLKWAHWHDTHTHTNNESISSLTCDMTHSYVWRDSRVRVTWLIHIQGANTHSSPPQRISRCAFEREWYESFVCVTWLVYMCDMTHLYVWHDWLICTHRGPLQKNSRYVFASVSDMIHPYTCCDSFMCVTWLTYMCVIIHVRARIAALRKEFLGVLSSVSDMNHSYVWHDSFICVTWLICMHA